LNPPPIAFTDRARARERSLHSLFEVISQGVADTSMVSFQDSLSDEDRWALAFHVGNFPFTDAERAAGEKLWRAEPALHARVPDLDALASLSEAALAADIGADKAAAVLAYLRAHPDAVAATNAGGLTLVRAQLAESVKAYQSGDAATATT